MLVKGGTGRQNLKLIYIMHTTCIILCGLCSGLIIVYLTRILHDYFLDNIGYNNENDPGPVKRHAWRSISTWWRFEWKHFPRYRLFVRNPSVTSQRQVTRRFDVFCDLRLNKWLSEHSRCRWFQTQSPSLCLFMRYTRYEKALEIIT